MTRHLQNISHKLIPAANRPIFLCSYAINDQKLVERLCRDVYFPMAPISSGHLAAMYGILHVLLEEFTIMRNPLCQKYDIKLHATRCEQNFNSIIESYEVLAVPSFENIFALFMGVSELGILKKVRIIDIISVYKSTE